MGNNAHQNKVNGKVTRSTNAETGNASYLPKGKAYELHSWPRKPKLGRWKPLIRVNREPI